MKQLSFCLLLAICFSCNSNGKQTVSKPENETTTTESNYEPKTGISDYSDNKESFMLTCNVDASNSLGGENQERVKQFCECAWEKTKGKYKGGIVADKSKLEKDPVLKECYENAINK